MIVSHNELVAAVNKAFMGMKRSCGEADVVANMVADLQMVGLHGVNHFNNASDFIGQEDDQPVNIQQPDKNTINVDLRKASVACHLPLILDFALEKMVGKKALTIELKNCHNRWLAYSELVKLAAKGIACSAKWCNGSNPKHTLYILNRGYITPELFLTASTEADINKLHDMTIELSIHDFDVKKLSEGYETYIDARELKIAQDRAWSEGILVDDNQWEKLKQSASAILVENSERSIQGAGEIS